MVLANGEYCMPYGTVETSDCGSVVCLREKPRVEFKVNTGMYLCNAELFDYIDDSEKIDMPDLIQRCLNAVVAGLGRRCVRSLTLSIIQG